MTYFGKTVADSLFLIKQLEVFQSGEKAFKAYQHESKPVAIYALTQHLNTLSDAKDIGSENPVFMSRLQIFREMAFTHARLSRIYEEQAEEDLSAKHISQALHYIAQTDIFAGVTNQAALMDVVAKFDDKGVP